MAKRSRSGSPPASSRPSASQSRPSSIPAVASAVDGRAAAMAWRMRHPWPPWHPRRTQRRRWRAVRKAWARRSGIWIHAPLLEGRGAWGRPPGRRLRPLRRGAPPTGGGDPPSDPPPPRRGRPRRGPGRPRCGSPAGASHAPEPAPSGRLDAVAPAGTGAPQPALPLHEPPAALRVQPVLEAPAAPHASPLQQLDEFTEGATTPARYSIVRHLWPDPSLPGAQTPPKRHGPRSRAPAGRASRAAACRPGLP